MAPRYSTPRPSKVLSLKTTLMDRWSSRLSSKRAVSKLLLGGPRRYRSGTRRPCHRRASRSPSRRRDGGRSVLRKNVPRPVSTPSRHHDPRPQAAFAYRIVPHGPPSPLSLAPRGPRRRRLPQERISAAVIADGAPRRPRRAKRVHGPCSFVAYWLAI